VPIDSVQAIFREIPAASAVPQLSLTRRDRELLMEEGVTPLEVASAEQAAMCWQKKEDLREQGRKPSRGEDTKMAKEQQRQVNQETQEQEETGTLFNDRS